jgi:predicted site-specific integrase-resolvase
LSTPSELWLVEDKERTMPPKEALINHTSGIKCTAIYARVSTEDQGKGFSTPTQIDPCQKLPQHKGYTVPDPYTCIDEGTSHIRLNRPGLRKLRDLMNARHCRYDCY